jgi:hypothetical protein
VIFAVSATVCGPTYVAALDADPGNLHPLRTVRPTANPVLTFVYDTLININEDGTVVSQLAPRSGRSGPGRHHDPFTAGGEVFRVPAGGEDETILSATAPDRVDTIVVDHEDAAVATTCVEGVTAG